MTERANILLKKLDWKPVLKDKSRLVEVFKKFNLNDFDLILEFQLQFGGLIFKYGLEPICWGVHHQSPRGEFKYYGEEIIVFNNEDDYPECSLLCADTLCQIRWTIDKSGAIFEDFDILANSFEKIVEDYALWEEVVTNGEKEVFQREIYGKSLKKIIENLESVIPIEELQEPGIKWFKFQKDCLLVEKNTEIIVLGPKSYNLHQRKEVVEKIE